MCEARNVPETGFGKGSERRLGPSEAIAPDPLSGVCYVLEYVFDRS